MKKGIAITTFWFWSINVGCSQGNNFKNNKEVKISKDQYNNISKTIKTYPYNPTYRLKINSVACTYEVYVNDMLADYDFNRGNSAGEQPIDIPQFILKSGKQKLRIRIYPKAIEDGELEKMITASANFSLRVLHGEYYKMPQDSFKEVYAIKMPQEVNGIPYYEITGEFVAEVPYMLQGWSDGLDLTKEDSKKLKDEVLATYERFRKAFEEKDVPTIASIIYKREQEIAQAFFFTSGKGTNYDRGWEELQQKVDAIKEMHPIEDYELRFFGERRVVALLKINGRLRNFPTVYGETNNEKLRFYGLFLYRPKPGAPLEVIR